MLEVGDPSSYVYFVTKQLSRRWVRFNCPVRMDSARQVPIAERTDITFEWAPADLQRLPSRTQ